MTETTPAVSGGAPKKHLSGKKARKWILLGVLAVAVIGGGTAFLSRTKAKAGDHLYHRCRGKAEHHQLTHRQRHPGACRLLHRYHPGLRRGPKRHL